MPTPPFFFGCPVLQRFVQTTEPLIQWDLYDRDPWEELKGQVESERPTGIVVRRRALLCVAFSFEEIAFSLKKLRHHDDQASLLRDIFGPIRGPADLDKLIERVEEVSDDVIARIVNDRMLDELGANQVTLNTREGIREASNIAKSSTRFLQRCWGQPEELSPCGMELARVLETLHVAYDRRFGYFKTIFSKSIFKEVSNG